MIEKALQLVKPNKSWKCAVVLMEPLFKFTDHAVDQLTLQWYYKNFEVLFLFIYVVCWSQIQV